MHQSRKRTSRKTSKQTHLHRSKIAKKIIKRAAGPISRQLVRIVDNQFLCQRGLSQAMSGATRRIRFFHCNPCSLNPLTRVQRAETRLVTIKTWIMKRPRPNQRFFQQSSPSRNSSAHLLDLKVRFKFSNKSKKICKNLNCSVLLLEEAQVLQKDYLDKDQPPRALQIMLLTYSQSKSSKWHPRPRSTLAWRYSSATKSKTELMIP